MKLYLGIFPLLFSLHLPSRQLLFVASIVLNVIDTIEDQCLDYNDLLKTVFFFLCGCICGMWKFPGQGASPHHSSGNTGSLTHWATKEQHESLLKGKHGTQSRALKVSQVTEHGDKHSVGHNSNETHKRTSWDVPSWGPRKREAPFSSQPVQLSGCVMSHGGRFVRQLV